MKTRTIIEELSQEDLVNLLATATYGSNWLGIRTGEKTGVQEDESDCLEDIWAKALLAGHKLKCTDYYAEGERYGSLGCVIKDEDEVTYFVGLKEVLEGLQKCADGTFKHGDKDYDVRAVNWVAKCFKHFKDEDPEFDVTEAEALMQVIIFGELIYG